MICLSEQQVDFILDDIRRRGIEMEDLQYNLLDHICCILEQELEEQDDFERLYDDVISRFYKTSLKEIQEETIQLLTLKHYHVMKRMLFLSGATSTVGFIIGSILKILSLPGAAALYILAATTFSLLFLPLLCILKLKESKSKRDQLVMGLSTLVGILYCLSSLGAVFHWQFNTYLWLSTVSISALVLIPVYFFTGIRDITTRTNTIITSIVMIGATSMVFLLINLKQPANTSSKIVSQQVAVK